MSEDSINSDTLTTYLNKMTDIKEVIPIHINDDETNNEN